MSLDALRAEIHGLPSGVWTRLVWGAVLGGVLGFLLYREHVRLLGAADGHRAGLILGGLVFVCGVLAGWRLGVRAPDLYRVTELYWRVMRCPVCGFDLRGLRVEGDGCAVCPECGGAWRVAEVVRWG